MACCLILCVASPSYRFANIPVPTCALPPAAPEILQTESRKAGAYDKSCDVWSLGVILYILYVDIRPPLGIFTCVIAYGSRRVGQLWYMRTVDKPPLKVYIV